MSGAPTVVLPSRDDPVPAGAVALIGGPPGRRARIGGRSFWTPVRWVVLLTLLVSTLGFWQKAPCRTHAWAGDYQYTRACYTDVFALYNAEELSSGKTPYLDHAVEYPPVIGITMGLVAEITDPIVDLFPNDRVQRAQDALDRAEAGSDPAAIASARNALDYAEDRQGNYRFFDLTWALLTAFAALTAVCVARLAGRRPWDAALFALAPTLLLHGTTNWDLMAVGFASLGLLAWARRMPVAAGLLIGVATATKLYPLIFLVPLLALCWRAGKLREGLVTAVTAVLATLAVVVPVYLVSPAYGPGGTAKDKVADSPLKRFGDQGLAALAPHTTVDLPGGGTVTGINAVYRFYDLNEYRPADWDSLAYAAGQLRTKVDDDDWFGARAYTDAVNWLLHTEPDADGRSRPDHLNQVVTGLTILLILGIVALAVGAPRRPRLPQLLALILIGFLLVNKVYSPQYVLWVVPLVALARPRWRLFLAWQAAEVAVLFLRFQYFTQLDGGKSGAKALGWEWFCGAVVIRDLLLVAVAVAIVREILRPERDVVRTPVGAGSADAVDPVDDPAGGVLDGAPDVRGAWVDLPDPGPPPELALSR